MHGEVACGVSAAVPVLVPVSYLTGEGQRGGHLLHGQVPDAGAERAAAGRAAAQLLAALVTDQVTRLALQDGRQDVVEAHRALEQGRQLRGLARKPRGRRQGAGGGRSDAARPGDRGHTGGGRRCCGRSGCGRSGG